MSERITNLFDMTKVPADVLRQELLRRECDEAGHPTETAIKVDGKLLHYWCRCGKVRWVRG